MHTPKKTLISELLLKEIDELGLDLDDETKADELPPLDDDNDLDSNLDLKSDIPDEAGDKELEDIGIEPTPEPLERPQTTTPNPTPQGYGAVDAVRAITGIEQNWMQIADQLGLEGDNLSAWLEVLGPIKEIKGLITNFSAKGKGTANMQRPVGGPGRLDADEDISL